jgi:hypothetical protein
MENYISNQDRLDLKKLMDNTENYQDNTEYIRSVKHSAKIRDDILCMENYKKEKKELYETNIELFKEQISVICNFLYTNYPDIFNKVIKNEINNDIMMALLEVLSMIEEGKLEQQEGSIIVGKILKKLYLDSAVRHADNLDKQYEKPKINDGRDLKWKKYKENNNI